MTISNTRQFSYVFFYFYLETGRKTLKLNALPTLNLPVKSHESAPTTERREIIRHVTETFEAPMPTYTNFQELCIRAEKLKLQPWTLTRNDSGLELSFPSKEFFVPRYQILINESLEVTCCVFGWRVPASAQFIQDHSLIDTTISTLTKEIELTAICEGVSQEVEGTVLHS